MHGTRETRDKLVRLEQRCEALTKALTEASDLIQAALNKG
jgi:hypothetical protein